MKAEWSEYLEGIGIRALFMKRAEEVVDFYANLYRDHINDIFVSEYIDKDGNRQYEGMWLFSDERVCEAKNFLHEDNYDSAIIKNQVKLWRIKKIDYDFKSATSKSRLVVEFSLVTNISGTLKASHSNCDHLRDSFTRYLLPNETGGRILAQQDDTTPDIE